MSVNATGGTLHRPPGYMERQMRVSQLAHALFHLDHPVGTPDGAEYLIRADAILTERGDKRRYWGYA